MGEFEDMLRDMVNITGVKPVTMHYTYTVTKVECGSNPDRVNHTEDVTQVTCKRCEKGRGYRNALNEANRKARMAAMEARGVLPYMLVRDVNRGDFGLVDSLEWTFPGVTFWGREVPGVSYGDLDVMQRSVEAVSLDQIMRVGDRVVFTCTSTYKSGIVAQVTRDEARITTPDGRVEIVTAAEVGYCLNMNELTVTTAAEVTADLCEACKVNPSTSTVTGKIYIGASFAIPADACVFLVCRPCRKAMMATVDSQGHGDMVVYWHPRLSDAQRTYRFDRGDCDRFVFFGANFDTLIVKAREVVRVRQPGYAPSISGLIFNDPNQQRAYLVHRDGGEQVKYMTRNQAGGQAWDAYTAGVKRFACVEVDPLTGKGVEVVGTFPYEVTVLNGLMEDFSASESIARADAWYGEVHGTPVDHVVDLEPLTGRVAVAESAEVFRIAGTPEFGRVYNGTSDHKITKFEGRCCNDKITGHLHMSPQVTVIAEQPIGPKPVRRAATLGDTFLIDGNRYILANRQHANPVLIPA